jgi:hypothetical protein
LEQKAERFSIWRIWFVMLGALCSVKQASICDGFAFGPFSFQQDGLPASEVGINRHQIIDALVIAQMVVVRGEGVGTIQSARTRWVCQARSSGNLTQTATIRPGRTYP